MKFIFYAVVFLHHVFLWGNFFSAICLPIYTNWFIWIPLESFLINLFFNPTFARCPLTKLENKIRTNLGLPEIKSFLGYYYLGKR